MTSEYSTALAQTAQNLGMNPNELDLIIFIESSRDAKWLNHKNSSGYGGIMQWGNAAASDLGYTGIDDLLAKNTSFTAQFQVAEQWIRLLWKRFGRKSDAGFLYLCHFLPYNAKNWGKWETVLQGKTKSGKVFDIIKGTNTYTQNKGLDYNQDGKITIGDIRDIVAAKAKKAGLISPLPSLPNKPIVAQNLDTSTGENISPIKIISGLTISIALFLIIQNYTTKQHYAF